MLINITESEIDKPIYRIISLERLLELFVTKKNTLVKPKTWEDVFENFIRQRRGEIAEYNLHDRMYGQCWTLQKASDAMWRIYSSDKKGLRIRTTIRKLAESLGNSQPSLPDVRCRIGKVEYLSEKKLMEVANSTFDDSGIGVDELFRSLLVKRRAFVHESEVRAIYYEIDDISFSNDLYRYEIDPHYLIDQIMIDPRRSYEEFIGIKKIIQETTGFRGKIKRSLLYTLPRDITIDVTNILSGSGTQQVACSDANYAALHLRRTASTLGPDRIYSHP